MRATDTPPRTAPRARTGPLTGQRRSWALAAVATVGAGATFSIPGVLNGTAAMNGSARGTAAVIVLLAVPALLATTVPGRAGSDWVTSPQATVIRLGAVAYLAYNSVLFAFATPFNELFLVYVAMLGLSVFTLFELGREVDVAAFERCRPALGRARAVATFIGAIAVANTLVWLGGILPALGHADDPPFLEGTGLTTNPTYVQDLSLWLPLAGLAAVQLWRRRPWGVVLAGGLLSMWVLEGVSVAVDQWFGSRADPHSPVVSSTMVVPFLVLAGVTLAVLIVLLNGIRTTEPPPVAGSDVRARAS
jgi:hypothetical protein